MPWGRWAAEPQPGAISNSTVRFRRGLGLCACAGVVLASLVSGFGLPQRVAASARPAPPTGVSAASTAPGQATVSWTPPAGGVAEGVTGYSVTTWNDLGAQVGSAQPVSGEAATSAPVTGLTNGTPWFFEVASVNGAGNSSGVPSNSVTPLSGVAPAGGMTAVSTRQYQLPNSDGSTWQVMDETNLAFTMTPGSSEDVLLSANSDLWTSTAGYNQDIGILVTPSGGSPVLAAWKESGGFAGTYSPNAAYVETVYLMTQGTTYTVQIVWKTNKPAIGATIAAAAGSSPTFSPTRLTADVLPAWSQTAVSTQQYPLLGSDGSTWVPMDATTLTVTLSPSSSEDAVVSGNSDLWTCNAGYNQDIGIFVSDNGGTPTLVAWKESGGFAGTYSPNAAYVQTVYPMTQGHTYVFTLEWKTNKAAPGVTIEAGAGAGPTVFSPTRLTAYPMPSAGVATVMSTQQYPLVGSDGSTWVPIDATQLVQSVTGSAETVLVSGNVDLWTCNAGYNQDIGIFVSVDGGTATLLAWKESGGFAGTYSPNAAFVQTVDTMSSGHTYAFSLEWKTNIRASGVTIEAAAGGGPTIYSPTRLTVVPQETATTGQTSQSISFTSTAPADAVVGGATYTPTATGGASGNPVTIAVDSSSASNCSISAGAVSFTAVGSCELDANQLGSSTYTAAPQVQQSFTVGQGSQSISFTSTAPSNAVVGGPTYTPTATATSGLPVTLTIDPSSASDCSISDGSVSFPTTVGTCIVDANQAGSSNYTAASQAQQSFTVGKGAQTIAFMSNAPADAVVGGPIYTPTATATSGLPVTITVDSSSSSVCALSSSTVSFIATGTCIIDANQVGSSSYEAALQVQQSFSVGKGSQTITFTSTAPSNAVVGGDAYTPTATATSGLSVTFSIDPSSTADCSISDGTVAFLSAAGTCVIDANQAGSADFTAAPQVQQSFSVGKGSQTITFTSTAPPNAVVGGATYTPTAIGGASGKSVIFSIDPSSTAGCSISAGAISFTAVGTCVVDANQAGSANFTAAAQAQQSFSVGKGSQTITFTSTAPADAVVGGATYTPTATSGASGNSVIFSIDPSSTAGCALSAGAISFTAVGTCVVDANQAGSANYEAASQVQQSFTVGKGSQTITFTSTAPGGATVGGATYTPTATGGASDTPVVVTVDGSSTSDCLITGGVVSFPTGARELSSMATLAAGPDAGDVVLFGGADGNSTDFDDTWLFTGTTWTQVHPPVSPSARAWASMATLKAGPDSGDVILFGGYGSNGFLGDTWIFDGTTWTEVAPATSPSARNLVSMATLTSGPDAGDVVLFGGTQGNNTFFDDTWIFDGTDWAELSPATSPPARNSAPVTTLTTGPDAGDVVLFSGNGAGGGQLDDTWMFNGVTWTEADPATSPPPRYNSAMTTPSAGTDAGDAVLFGGFGAGTLGDTWIFDGTTWTEVSPAASPPPRGLLAMATLASGPDAGDVVMLGGATDWSTYESPLGDAWLYNGMSWTQIDPPASAATGSCVIDANQAGNANFTAAAQAQQPFTVGQGSQSISITSTAPTDATVDGPNYDVTATGGASDYPVVLTVDGSSTSHCSITDGVVSFPTTARLLSSMATLATGPDTGDVVLFGGNGAGGGALGDTWLFDGTTWTQVHPSVSPSARAWTSMATLRGGPDAGDVVLFGGYDGTGFLDDTWIFNGTAWSEVTSPTSPSARNLVSMATLTSGQDAGDVVLFGGTEGNSTYFDDTWIFNGTKWTELSPATSPPGRNSAPMATLTSGSHTGDVVLFGGNGAGGGQLDDTWIFNGTTWSDADPGTSPPSRYNSSLATLSAGPDAGDAVLFGGFSPGALGDTWIFDGTNWTQLSPAASPSPRGLLTMATLGGGPDAGDVIMLGGATDWSTYTSPLGDAWLFDGTTWTQVNPPTSPSIGTCVIDANQAGNANFSAAAQAQQSFTVGQGSQTISFTSDAPTDATVGGPAYTLSATGGPSGNPVLFSVDGASTSDCTISGSVVSFPTTAGSCVIDADQAGDANFGAAPETQQSFTVGQGSQTITFTSTAPTGAAVGGATYTPTGTATSGLPVAFTIDSSSASTCSISAGVVSFTAVGTCVIDADQSGNANYSAALQAQQAIPVIPIAHVSGTLSQNTVWSAQLALTYVIDSAVDVPVGVTLTIQPGTVIKSGGGAITVEGSLTAVGTTAAPIVFTSINDNSVGGATGSGSPTAGDWGIESSAGGSIDIEHADIDYARTAVNAGGSGGLTIENDSFSSEYGGVASSGSAAPVIEGNTFVSPGGEAVSVIASGTPTVEANAVSGPDGAAFAVDGLAIDPALLSGNTVSGGPSSFRLAGQVTTSGVLPSLDVPWQVGYFNWASGATTGACLDVPASVTLTLTPGTIIKGEGGGESYSPDCPAPGPVVGAISVEGSLTAVGTTAAPIVFTSINDNSVGGATGSGSPTAGDW
ncbi:MAG: kelch repeat-containing protein, partial [Candidatus Dormibacteria bacterium]